jgi:hypothetical protein
LPAVDGAGDERDELRLALPLWLIGMLLLLVGILRRRPLLALGGAAAIVYDRRSVPAERTLGTIGALARRTHDDTPD